MVRTVWHYKLTAKGIISELVPVDLDYPSETGVCLSENCFRLLDKMYISKKAVEMWSDSGCSGRELVLKFRAGVTDYYNKTKRALKKYEPMYLEQLVNSSFTMDVPFEHSPESFISDGVSQYFSELEKVLDAWYKRVKKEIELGEKDDEG